MKIIKKTNLPYLVATKLRRDKIAKQVIAFLGQPPIQMVQEKDL